MNEVYRGYFPDNFPARATVITGLVKEEFLVEISAVAIMGLSKDVEQIIRKVLTSVSE